MAGDRPTQARPWTRRPRAAPRGQATGSATRVQASSIALFHSHSILAASLRPTLPVLDTPVAHLCRRGMEREQLIGSGSRGTSLGGSDRSIGMARPCPVCPVRSQKQPLLPHPLRRLQLSKIPHPPLPLTPFLRGLFHHPTRAKKDLTEIK